ncbi:MAG TPA: inositol monophosphatase family protein, partial [Elusimicrobiota bacterium]|nr:inositol monophosphatase family protein [Elusimicrobiota bacterium]
MNRIKAFVPSFSSWKKRLAFCVAVLFSHANLFAVSTTEKNFWAHRRQQIEKNKTAEPPVPVVASLPPTADPAAVLRDLPSVNAQRLNRLTAGMERELAGHGDEVLSRKVADVARFLPAQFGTIRKVSLPSSIASPKIIVHVQDVHRNSEAQQNIGAALQSLVEQNSVQLVALEGAFQPLRVDRYRDSLSPAALGHTADYLLRENLISGPIHAAMTSTQPVPPIRGIDHAQYYDANVEAYRQSVPLVQRVKGELQIIRQDLDRRKEAVFNEDLKRFDRQVASYQSKQISLGDYLTALTGVPSAPVPESIRTFLDALTMEQSLDFKKIEQERALLLDALVAKLSKDQIQGLLNQSLSFRLGRIRHTDFYRYLHELCMKPGLSLDRYPAMDSYIRYVFLSDTINPETLFKDMAALEKRDYDLLAKTDPERDLVGQSKQFVLTQKLVDFTLSSDEWNEYEKNPMRSPDLPLQSFEEFFRQAEARDTAMTDNLIALMGPKEVSTAVLVTGGFHTSGMEKKLKDAGYVTIQYVPKIARVDAEHGADYLSVFTQEKTPLEKLFKGDVLFVPDHPARGIEKGATARTVASAEQAIHGDRADQIESTLKKLGGTESVDDVRLTPNGIDFEMTSDDGQVVDVSLRHDRRKGVGEFKAVPARGFSLARAKAGRVMSNIIASLRERVGFKKPAGTGIVELRGFSDGLMATARQTIRDLLAQGKPKEEKKVDGSIVTAIDRAVQQRVLEQIQKTYPGHYLVAEETLDSKEAAVNKGNAGSEYVWVLDPIDGTAQFSAGSDFYAVSLALYRQGRPVLAMVWSPVFGLLEASDDRPGVYLNGTSFDTAQNGYQGELNAVIAGRSDFSDRLNDLVKKKAVSGDVRVAAIENHAKSSVVHSAEVLLGKTQIYSYVGDGYGLGLWDIAAVAYLLDKGGRPFYSRAPDGRLQPVLSRIQQDIQDHPQTADKKFPPYNTVSGDGKVMKLLELADGDSPLTTEETQKPAEAKPAEDVLAALFRDDVRDTDDAWNRWLAQMTSRPTIPMAWGSTPEALRYNNYYDVLTENHRKGMQHLVNRDWQSAYQCAETVIRTINDNP